MRSLTIALGALLAAAPASAAQNLIGDGGFEANPPQIGGYGHVAGGDSFDGGLWRVTGVDILQVDTAYQVGNGPALVFNAHAGRASLDLTGTGNSSPLDGVYQDVATTIGQSYALSFWVGRVVASGSTSGDYTNAATMRLAIGNGPVMDFVNDDVIANGIAWRKFDWTFEATGALTRIAFSNGGGNDYLGLDDVSLVSTDVPEPAAWTMMLGGFALVGGALRRRHATRATA